MDARWDHLKIIAVCASREDSENLNCSPHRLTAGNKKNVAFRAKKRYTNICRVRDEGWVLCDSPA